MDARNHRAHYSCVWLMLICTFVMVMNKTVNSQGFGVGTAAGGDVDSDGSGHSSVVEVDFAAAAAVDDVSVVASARPHTSAYGCSSRSNRSAFHVVYSHRCVCFVGRLSSFVDRVR